MEGQIGQPHGSKARVEGVVKEAKIARREHIKPPPKGNAKEMIKKVRGDFLKKGREQSDAQSTPHRRCHRGRERSSRW
jgi:hypothetical protein